MVRRMKVTITEIESTVTPSGNSGHVVVPKAWIGKEAIVKLKEKENRNKKEETAMKRMTTYYMNLLLTIFN